MGGGDLNLKKSWHPSTLKNIERVWKAEQKHTAEQKKIEQLQKELQDERGREEMRQFAENKGVIERKSDRLDWMYAGPAAMVERDEYLLGRQVDKTFEVMNSHAQGLMDQSANEVKQPGAIFSEPNTNISVDLASKVQQDPLFAIKKKEQQAKKDILMNPVKMKQLQQYLKKAVKKSKKKKSKKKKSKISSHSSDDSDTSADDRKSSRTSHRDKGYHSTKKNRPQDDTRHRHDIYRSSKYVRQNYSSADERYEKESNRIRSEKRLSHRKNYKRESPDSQDSNEDNRRNNSSDDEVKPKKYGLIHGKRRKGDDSPVGRIDYRKIKIEKPKVYKAEPRRKLSEREINERRKEMMDNAKWRDDQRSKNVQQYREEAAKEMENHRSSKGAKFIAPMLSRIAESGSVEARIKSNKYNIQRSGTDLNKNFAKRTS